MGSDTRRLEGKVAVVTGGAYGNGRGIALRYADLGADVAIADVDAERMEETSDMVRERGRRALAQHCDVSKKPDLDALFDAVVREFGRVDIAVANAIGPGFIETGMTEALKENPLFEAYLVDRTPTGNIGKPEDVANVAAFLASDDSGFVNGTIIFPDGGITAGLYSAGVLQQPD